MKKVLYAAVLMSFFMGTTVLTSVAATDHEAHHPGGDQPAAPTSSERLTAGMNHDMDLGPTDDTYDLRFIDGMIIHHEGAVEMAREAQLNSQRPEILELADAIIASQADEIELMNRWKKEWYPQADSTPVAYDPGSGRTVPMSQAYITAMKMSGDLGAQDDQFDLRFIEAMIPHHQSAVDMALDALDKTQRAEIRNMANEIITAQESEINLMMSWKILWYDR